MDPKNKIYNEGKKAFEQRTAKLSECPYHGQEKEQWTQGWDHAQSKAANEWANSHYFQNI